MRWRNSSGMEILWPVLLLLLATIGVCDGSRRTAQRRQDVSRTPKLYIPEPSPESLSALAHAMGAAGFEHYTEGRALVKRLIPANSQPDLDLVEHQGVVGRAGVDFPAYPNIPNTGFNCKNVLTGYYADLETDCQVFHICDTSRKISFLCPNGTIFSQSHLICDWWFKVDCASAPALYESSAEYYSNEQKKSQKITQSLSKNQDLQQLAETNIRTETRRPVAIPVSSTTERVYRGRQRQQETPYVPQATARSYQALFPDPKHNNNPTQRSQLTTAFEKRRKSLVQLISNNFAVPARSTVPTYDASTLRTTPDYSLREMQVAAESASFAANNNNRQFLQDYNAKNYRPYPVYTPSTTTKKPERTRARTNPNLTTLYDIREKQQTQTHYSRVSPPSTKRPTLVTYTKSYTTVNDNPYTRPGVSLLKNYIEKEKNRTAATTAATPRHPQATRNTKPNEIKKITFKPRESFESATKIPTTRADVFYSQTASSDRHDVFSTANQIAEVTTEPSYKERRERLMRKLNLDTYVPTEATVPTTDNEFNDEQANSKLNAPPSLTPKTLHSLAIYYATALDNLSTTPTPDEGEVTTPAFDEYETMEEALPALFSSSTINKYGSLFSNGASNAELLEEIKADPNGTYNELMEDLMVQQSQSPLATSPQIRELAQVFTHALSAYLQDPVQFRKVLSDIRPTHPSFGENYGDVIGTTDDTTNTEPTTTVNEEDDEILGFSEDNKARPISSLREPKALDLGNKFQSNSADSKYQSVTPDSKYQSVSPDFKYQTIAADITYPTISTLPQYSTTIADISTTPRPTEYISSTTYKSTRRNPFICCGRISASYTSPSTPLAPSISPVYTNTNAYTINSLASEVSTTESAVPRYGGFQNNALTVGDSQYGTGVTESKPLNEYVETVNLPAAWGIDASASTPNSISTQDFESKKIRTTTVLPTTSTAYFTETDSVELENEEELQRAHSQSFIAPSGNSIRHGKQLNLEASTVKKPAEDLEAPTLPDTEPTTVQTTPSTTITQEEVLTTTPIPPSIFTSPDVDHQTSHIIWSTTFDNWHSTMLDPLSLNDGLRTELQEINPTVEDSSYTGSTPTPTINYATTESVSTTNNIEPTTDDIKSENRRGKSLKDLSTEPSQDLSAITDTVVEKAKEIMNSTTAEKLMNVMKKTKSKTVKRLILLLVQTCDDDYNTTAEASKKALLEALMAVSQKDMEEIAKEEEEGIVDNKAPEADSLRRTDRFVERQDVRPSQERRGKSLSFDPSAINSLSNPTTEKLQTTEEQVAISTTQAPYRTSRRGARKFASRTTPVEPRSTKPTFAETKPTFADTKPTLVETKPTFADTKPTLPDTKPTLPDTKPTFADTKPTFADIPVAEARVAKETDLKTASDTRALELLRSLYTIAARWG